MSKDFSFKNSNYSSADSAKYPNIDARFETIEGKVNTQKAEYAKFVNEFTVIPRHKYISQRIFDSTFKGETLGDSLVYGVGVDTAESKWQAVYGKLMDSYAGLEAEYTDYVPDNHGVPSSCIDNVLGYVSPYLDATGNIATKSYAYGMPYIVINTSINDKSRYYFSGWFKYFALQYRLAVRQLIKSGIDVVCMTEPNTINMSTGEFDSHTLNNEQWRLAQEIRRIAADEGASLVDYELAWNQMKDAGVDLRQYYIPDGIHPNVAGHNIRGEMLFKCMTQPSVAPSRTYDASPNTKLNAWSLSQYNATDLVNTTLVPITFDSATTARKLAVGTSDAYKIKAGGSATFKFPAGKKIHGVCVTCMQGNGGTGTLSIECPVGTSVQEFGHDLTYTVGNTTSKLEMSYYFPVSTDAKNTVKVKATTDDIYVTGVTAIVDYEDSLVNKKFKLSDDLISVNDDFISFDTTKWASNVTEAGTSSSTATIDENSLLKLTTDNAINDAIQIQSSGAIPLDSKPVIFETKIKLSEVTNTLFVIGLHAVKSGVYTTVSSGCFFKHYAADNVLRTMVVNAGAADATLRNLTMVNDVWYNLKIVINTGGNDISGFGDITAEFFIDGVSVGTNTKTMTLSTKLAITLAVQTNNAVAKTLYVDYVKCAKLR